MKFPSILVVFDTPPSHQYYQEKNRLLGFFSSSVLGKFSILGFFVLSKFLSEEKIVNCKNFFLCKNIVSAGRFSILLTFGLCRVIFDFIEFLEIAQKNSS